MLSLLGRRSKTLQPFMMRRPRNLKRHHKQTRARSNSGHINVVRRIFKYGFVSVAAMVGVYVGFLGLLTTQTFQRHAVYLHAFQMTWFKDLAVPEMFGFLRNQVTPFSITSSDGEKLFAWHILPLERYRKHEKELLSEPVGYVDDVTSRVGFRLLKEDPEARLVIHMHGAGGTVGSGYRCPNYRALSAGDPEKIHILTFDYRGYGHSTGSPSEEGILRDAVAAVDWAINVAGIPPSRIAFFGQSMGTAVVLGVLEHFAHRSPPVSFSGAVLVASFVDVPTLVSTYRILKTIPVLSPLAKFPTLFSYLSTYIKDQWPSKERIASYVRANERNGERYKLTLIHAEDDADIPWHHTTELFKLAVNATVGESTEYTDFDKEKDKLRIDRGAAGSTVTWRTENGVIREEIVKYGRHNVLMGEPIVTISIMRILQGFAE